MSGQELKEKLRAEGVNFTQLAHKLGYACDQNLHSLFGAKDVKTGLLEEMAKALDKPIGWFYGQAFSFTEQTKTIAADNNSIAAGRDVHTNSEAFIEALRIQQELTRTALDQNSRLIAVIENLAKK